MVLVIGQGLKVVIDEGFARGQEKLLDTTLATMAGLIASLGVLTWFRVYNVYWIGARFTADLRLRLYDHLVTRHQRRDAHRGGDGRDSPLLVAHGDHDGRLRGDAFLHERQAHGARTRL